MTHGLPTRLHDLLEGYGWGPLFQMVWIEGGDLERVARLLRADLGSARECALGDHSVYEWDSPGDLPVAGAVWGGETGTGWTQVLPLAGFLLSALEVQAALTVGGGRLLHLHWNVVDGSRTLIHVVGGEVTTVVDGWGYTDGSDPAALDRYRLDLDLDLGPDTPWDVGISSMLTLVGRVVGRQVDREWLDAAHLRYLIPGDAWPEVTG
ncbi:hypothetical protein [Streptosporangium sp. NPDC051022]|uniref:hypothetical protein n=1 Tax=Streptosporangium sp. NPDC051022 TaxID=3155752 RepID=UPI003448581C